MSYVRIILLLFTFIFLSVKSFSQCAMCKAVAESDSGISVGLNDGILFLMAIPYILMAVIGYLIYKHYKKNKSSAE